MWGRSTLQWKKAQNGEEDASNLNSVLKDVLNSTEELVNLTEVNLNTKVEIKSRQKS